MKNIRFFFICISVFGGEIFNIFEKACFRNEYAKEERCSNILGPVVQN